MRFLIINPPYVIEEQGLALLPNKAMLPTGPLSIARALLAKTHKVTFLDMAPLGGFEGFEKLSSMLVSENQFDSILICCHTARNIPVCKRIIEKIRELLHKIPITFGGNLCTELGVEEFRRLDLEIEAVVRGYGHAPDVIRALEEKKSGDIFPETITSTLPISALHLLDQETYVWYREKSQGQYPIIGSGGFGCRWNCGYCSAKMGSSYVAREIKNTLEEVRAARDIGYRHLWCVGNVVLQKPEIVLEFAQVVSKLGLTWSGMTRPETVMDLRTLQMLKRNGLTEIAIGIESVSKLQLKLYKRGAGHEYFNKIKSAFSLLRKAGIGSNAFVMLDGPGGSESDFWNLYRLLKEINPDTVSWSFYNPPPQIGLLKENRNPVDYGFYHWPLGCSDIPPERVVQHSMILSGVWWKGWTLDEEQPYFGNKFGRGVRFKEGTLWQPRDARSPVGDIWEAWLEEDFLDPGSSPG